MALGTGGGGGGGQSAGGVRAGMAYVELIAKDKIGPVLDKVRGKLAGFGSAMTKAGAAGLAAGAAVLAPVTALFTAGVERFDHMAAEADRLNVPIDQFYRLSTAAEAAGVSIEQLAENPGRYADVLARVGDAPTESIRAAVEASREWRLTLISLKDAAASMAVDLLPMFKTFTGFVRDNREMVRVAAVVGAALAALGIAAVTLGVTLNVAAAALGALKAAFLLLVSPVGLVVAAVAGIGAVFLTQTQAGRQMASELGTLFRGIGETWGEAWGGIVAALRRGDVEQAFAVVTAALKVSWLQLMEFMRGEWEKTKASFVGDLTFGLSEAIHRWTGGAAGTGGPGAARDTPEMARARAELAAARAALRSAVQAAQTPAWRGPEGGGASSQITPAMMARVQGTFSGPLDQQLGAGKSWQRDVLGGIRRTNDLVAGGNELLEQVRNAIEHAPGLVFR